MCLPAVLSYDPKMYQLHIKFDAITFILTFKSWHNLTLKKLYTVAEELPFFEPLIAARQNSRVSGPINWLGIENIAFLWNLRAIVKEAKYPEPLHWEIREKFLPILSVSEGGYKTRGLWKILNLDTGLHFS